MLAVIDENKRDSSVCIVKIGGTSGEMVNKQYSPSSSTWCGEVLGWQRPDVSDRVSDYGGVSFVRLEAFGSASREGSRP
jgi:hypothetical protein